MLGMEKKEKETLSLACNATLSFLEVPARVLDRDNKRQTKYIIIQQLAKQTKSGSEMH